MENAHEIGLKKVAGLNEFLAKKVTGFATSELGKAFAADGVGAVLGNSGKALDQVKSLMQIAGLGAVTSLGLAAIMRKIQNSTRHRAIIEDLIQNDPIIKQGDTQDVLQIYAMIYNMAPNLAKEKPAVREILQNYVRIGRMDMQTIKTLIDTEEKLSKVDGAGLKSLIGG